MIKLFDRIKEISRSTGTGIFTLDGAAAGFSRFNEVYTNGDILFYAITDGTSYEVGSGVYSSNQLTQRFPFRSSNSNQRVNFPNGIKEVYVSYPAKYAVHTASGYSDFSQPQASGLAFWRNSTTLDYDSNLIWDRQSDRLGISKTPDWTLDVGGLAKSSGLIVDRSGVWFSGGNLGYAMGVQLEPFLKNVLNTETGTNAVFQHSGIVNQGWLFKKQSAATFFAGPPSGCGSPPCPADYPSFRGLHVKDIPSLSEFYMTQYADGVAGNIAFYRSSGIVEYDPLFTFDKTNNYLGINKSNPTKALDVVGEGRFTSNLTIGGNLDVQGGITYIDSSNVTIWDKQLELASMSGAALLNDSQIDDAGIVIKSTNGDKKWTWRDSTDAWTTDQKIQTSGIIFNDLSTISGAYRAGSGLVLNNGITFNVGNLFRIADQTTGSGWIHQADLLRVSGVNGLSTTYASGTRLLTISPASLSGYFETKISSSTYSAGSGLTLIGSQFNTSGTGNFQSIIVNAVSGATVTIRSSSGNASCIRMHRASGSQQTAAQFVADSGGATPSNTIINASGFLTIPVINSFCSGIVLLGSGAPSNRGVMFLASDVNRLYISNGSAWYFSSLTLDNTACSGAGSGGA